MIETGTGPALTKGKFNSVKGFANEMRLLAALLGRGYNASRVDLPLSSYGLVLEVVNGDFIRVQVKTVGPKGAISFTGGTRGGIDREYKSDVKSYVQSLETSEVVVGVRSNASNGDTEVDFFVVPTLYIEYLGQKSLSVNRFPQTRNNWDLLTQCKDPRYVKNLFSHYQVPE